MRILALLGLLLLSGCIVPYGPGPYPYYAGGYGYHGGYHGGYGGRY